MPASSGLGPVVGDPERGGTFGSLIDRPPVAVLAGHQPVEQQDSAGLDDGGPVPFESSFLFVGAVVAPRVGVQRCPAPAAHVEIIGLWIHGALPALLESIYVSTSGSRDPPVLHRFATLRDQTLIKGPRGCG